MTATYARRCYACGDVHLCQDVIRLCFCPFCSGGVAIETIAVTPDREAPTWLAELWREVSDAR